MLATPVSGPCLNPSVSLLQVLGPLSSFRNTPSAASAEYQLLLRLQWEEPWGSWVWVNYRGRPYTHCYCVLLPSVQKFSLSGSFPSILLSLPYAFFLPHTWLVLRSLIFELCQHEHWSFSPIEEVHSSSWGKIWLLRLHLNKPGLSSSREVRRKEHPAAGHIEMWPLTARDRRIELGFKHIFLKPEKGQSLRHQDS